jgi:hypothetical protein
LAEHFDPNVKFKKVIKKPLEISLTNVSGW